MRGVGYGYAVLDVMWGKCRLIYVLVYSLPPSSDSDYGAAQEQRELQDQAQRSGRWPPSSFVDSLPAPADSNHSLLHFLIVSVDIEASGDDLQLVYFPEEDADTDTIPPLNPNLSSEPRGGGLTISSFISTIASSASSSALFGSGPSQKALAVSEEWKGKGNVWSSCVCLNFSSLHWQPHSLFFVWCLLR